MAMVLISTEVRRELMRIAAAHSEEKRLVTRAVIVLSRLDDVPIEEVAANAGCGVTTVKKWMGRFLANPKVESLCDRPRSGRPYTIPTSVKVQVAAMACAEPDKNLVPFRDRWTLGSLSVAVFAVTGHHVSPSSVQRILSNRQIRPHKVKMWLHSPDPDFRQKAVVRHRGTICNIYVNPPKGVHIVSVDEKTGMQAVERKYPSKPSRTGVEGQREYEYIRHGTQSLIAAFDVLSGGVWGHCGDTRTAEDLMEFMEDLANNVYPEGQVIIIWDNLNIHGGERWEEFNKRHDGRFEFIHTPIHASWLNQIEIWFGILQARILRHGSFASVEELRASVLGFIDHWLEHEAHPFKWAFRAVRRCGTFEEQKGSQQQRELAA